MKPQLVILNGSLESKTISLADIDIFTIGRAVKNHLPISDYGLSREHALIRRTADGFMLEDLGSRNGTFVNGFPAQKLLLKHGDRIRVGQTHILFLTEEENQTMLFSDEIQFDDDAFLTQTDISILIEKDVTDLSTDFGVLTKIGKVLDRIQTSEELQQKLLEIILELIPAERGAIVLLNDDFTEPNSVCVLNKIQRGNVPMHISRTITNEVLGGKIAVLKNNITQATPETAESLISSGVNSVLCVPLLLGDISGLIYLDSDDILFKFENSHLQQMTAIANLVVAALKNVRYLEFLKIENESLQKWAQLETNMIGESEPMNLLAQLIAKVSQTDSTILISGESGTGKELVARAIHKNSPRNNKPFIALNCAVLNENFLDSDLFGHEKGAFTGAVGQRKGKIELAEGGTLFLDELGELAPSLQAKLLRVLQEREFERIGGGKPIKANVRVIAATNRNLAEEVKKGNFREDLFFRLNVVQIEVPPLRRRKSDIPLLVQHFTHKYSELCKRRVQGISPAAQQALVNHEWRGNVRELENAIERAIVLGSGDTIQLDDLPYEIIENRKPEHISPLDFHQQIKAAKRTIVLSAIKEAGGNYSEAARQLAIHPNNLHRIIRQLEIKDETKNLS
ncbi:MAG: sigma 54-interacting transcriptional regulator [Acidobacteriota bacterium]|nr:sigma 54-interacting transcriptional regulator [Acidobacteriota bacterium]